MNPFIRRRPAPSRRADAVLRANIVALTTHLDPLTARVREAEVAWLAGRPDYSPEDPVAATRSLVAAAHACLDARAAAEARADKLRALVAGVDEAGRRALLARYLRATIRDARQLRGDLAALRRDLDVDALLERDAGEVEHHGARLEVAVRALDGYGGALSRAEWEAAGAETLLHALALREGRPATHRAAVRALANSAARLVAGGTAGDPAGLRLLRQRARDPDEDPWIRRRAIEVVRGLDAALARPWLEEALDAVAGREPFLLRARAIELLLEVRAAWALDLAARQLGDPSELVRACLVDGLAARFAAGDTDDAEGAGVLLGRLLATDPDPRIRARAVDGLRLAGAKGLPPLADRLYDAPLVAHYAAEVAFDAARAGLALPEPLVRALEEARVTGAPTVSRTAALALLAARVVGRVVWDTAAPLEGMRSGESRQVTLPSGVTAVALAEALAVFAARGYGYSLAPQGRVVRITRGDVLREAPWRVLHELRNPAPAKRQGHPHSVGRADMGAIRVPPFGLAEESATGVPGQRVRVERVDGWGPTVPMVDDYLHATGRGAVLVVTAEGVCILRPPAERLARLRARLRLVLSYGRFDALRIAALEERDEALRRRYVAAMEELGFETRFEGAPGPQSPYFPALVNPVAYLVSMGANTLTHLAIVVALLLTILFGRASLARHRVRSARARIPLVVGGWGTRGKSGTERLKAAMFEGLGIPLLSKTTGCEAMVLHAPPGGRAMELFLFRPFDKATIWEQVDVVALAAGLGARTMLWECMGLNPAYVNLLQGGWMRDDLSTITNAYPDHEDIQGPTGMDVAAVLGGFAPPDALLFCTEENMLPVLAEEAAKRNTRVEPVRRADRELVPRDLMDRMPYAEHHANVALAAAVGQSLGIDRVEAIGLMAEHVVPDLGALVIYPRARHLGRDVVFANGMSANDTLSFRHNWRRTGFGAHDPVAEPARWLVTVVNNRADRVARSRVFAQILVNDANAHRHVLIGTNLRGLAQYVEQSLDERLAATMLGGPSTGVDGGATEAASVDAARVDALFAHLRLVEPGALGDTCARRLGAPEPLRHDWVAAARAVTSPRATLDAARAAAEGARAAAVALEAACPDGKGLADALIEALARWTCWRAARGAAADDVRLAYRALVRASLVLVEDSGTSGDRIMAIAIAAAPPGAEVWIMGVQNIKGTGLDFAYQWVFWRELHQHLARLGDRDPLRRRLALAGIDENPLGSALACEAARDALRPLLADPDVGARATMVSQRVEARLAVLLAARAGGERGRKQGRLAWLLERLVDPFDAILRSRRARRIFADLVARRISHRRAQAELKRLTERQKGGWLG